MEISFQKSSYVLGEPVPVRVRYGNETGETVRIDNPEESTRVHMHAVYQPTGEDLNYPMVPEEQIVLEPGTDEYVLSTPPVEKIEIPPGDALTFGTDLNQRLYLRPGEFDCVLTDDDAECNRVKIEILYTQETVEYLLAYARNPAEEYGRREWAMEWLQEIAPKFALKLSEPGASDELRAANEAYNRSHLDAFTKWWNQNRNNIKMPAR